MIFINKRETAFPDFCNDYETLRAEDVSPPLFDKPVVDNVVTETEEVQVVMLYEKGVMLNDGRKISVGSSFHYEAQEETLCGVCVECGLVMFRSGKRIYF